ncbi:hypothetical protein EUGRSUZ_F01511 [Eucalyptus grandis]|uniref:Uncharacterized protein n=2 Tax=Eucalyptus grandis TaxID=71139 RepID=A0A059BP05_EUCGR|nr:hypothetical protein EUGRSUZ_F01511 [Eucalyptus grandis]
MSRFWIHYLVDWKWPLRRLLIDIVSAYAPSLIFERWIDPSFYCFTSCFWIYNLVYWLYLLFLRNDLVDRGGCLRHGAYDDDGQLLHRITELFLSSTIYLHLSLVGWWIGSVLDHLPDW